MGRNRPSHPTWTSAVQRSRTAFCSHYVRVGELREVTRFALEAPPRVVVRHRAGRQDLQRDITLQALVARAIHDAHAARAELFNNAVTRESFADGSGHGVTPTTIVCPLGDRTPYLFESRLILRAVSVNVDGSPEADKTSSVTAPSRIF
jgi:hypothetical protein